MGGGNDVLIGAHIENVLDGEEGDDLLIGQAQNDFLAPGSENDTSIGGLGDDFFLMTGGQQTVEDEGGNDLLEFTFFQTPVNLDLDQTTRRQDLGDGQSLLINGVFERVVATRFADTIRAENLIGEARVINGGFPAFDDLGEPIPDFEDTLIVSAPDLQLEVLGDGDGNGNVIIEGDLIDFGPVTFERIENPIPINTPDPLNPIIRGTGKNDTLTITATGIRDATWTLVSSGMPDQTGTFSGVQSVRFDSLDGDDALVITGATFEPLRGINFNGGDGVDSLRNDSGRSEPAYYGLDVSKVLFAASFGQSTPSGPVDIHGSSVEVLNDTVTRTSFVVDTTNYREETGVISDQSNRANVRFNNGFTRSIELSLNEPTDSLSLTTSNKRYPTDDKMEVEKLTAGFQADLKVERWRNVEFTTAGKLTDRRVSLNADNIQIPQAITAGAFAFNRRQNRLWH